MRNHFFHLIFLVSLLSFGQTKETVNLESPYHTVHTHLFFLQEETYHIEKSAASIYGASDKEAAGIALKIKQVLDGKGLRVNMASLPRNANYLDTINGIELKNRYVLFPNQLPQIAVEKIGENWYYSRETNQSIQKLYREVYPIWTEYLKKTIPNVGHLKVFSIELWQYLGVVVLLLLGAGLFFVLKKIIFWFLKTVERAVVRFAHNSMNDSLRKLSRPLALLFVFFFLEKYLPILQFSIDINAVLLGGIHIAQTLLWIYVFLQFVEVLMDVYRSYSEKTESKLDDQLVPILKRLLRGLVIFVGVLKMLTIFGADVRTVIAGASIGGLAVALASQDTVKNLIGTFMIFLDKPFQIGDWIVGGGVEGTVEEVGFRSSRIRAADTSIFTIPNSKLSEIVINNKGLRKYRRYKTVLGIRYDTPPELIEAFVKGVRQIIEAHPETLTESYNVEVPGFGDSALQVLVNTYFLSLEWGVEQSSKHRLHMAIVKLAKALGVDFAFPSQTVMIEQFPEKKATEMQYEVAEEKINTSISAVLDAFKKEAQ
jgi:MscS family membrane protein